MVRYCCRYCCCPVLAFPQPTTNRYFQLLTTLLSDKNVKPRLQRDIPTLFVYGKRKRAFFHSQKWLALLDKCDSSEHHGLDCGHWVQTQQPDTLVALMRRWLGLPVATPDAAAATAPAAAQAPAATTAGGAEHKEQEASL